MDPIIEVFRFTSIHPTFHQFFKACWEHLFNGPGQLCYAHRHYVALMAASRHRCLTLMDYHYAKVKEYDRDIEWLNGLKHSDPRFIALDELNRYMAHRPWNISADLIHKLVGRGSPDAQKTFTLCELNHAAILMAQTHVLCSFVCSVGLERRTDLMQSEIDFLNCDENDISIRNKENDKKTNGDVEKIINCMISLNNSSDEGVNSFNTIDKMEKDSSSSDSSSDDDGESYPHFTETPQYTYVDFQTRPERQIKTFKIHEFSWDHAFNLINDLSSETASRLDRMFSDIQRMTYKFMGAVDHVDTRTYRNAVWNYVQGLFGIKYDDYDYSQVNKLLDIETKSYIKNAACFPYRISDEFFSVMPGFKTSEKIHVVIMVMESRFQAILLHFTRALCNYNAQTMAKKGYRRPLD